MTNSRDSSGGYLTGNESERLWDEDEEDAFFSAHGDEDDDLSPDPADSVESVWARAFDVAAEIAANTRAIDRANRLTFFDPNDEPIEELEARSRTLADERSELEYQMRMRGFPPRGWAPPPAVPRLSVTATSSSAPSGRSVPPAQILRPGLTDEEYQHWEWLDQGLTQSEVARRVGVSQVAISKREGKLRARIDAVYIEQTGRPYHWTPIPKPQGGRRRKR